MITNEVKRNYIEIFKEIIEIIDLKMVFIL